MHRPQKLPASSRCWLLLGLVAAALWPTLGLAQAIVRGQEPDVLRLLLPYVDDGPVGDGGKLSRIALGQDAIELDVVAPSGQVGSLRLTPRPRGDTQPGSKSFRIAAPDAPTPELALSQQLLRAAIVRNDDGAFFANAPSVKSPNQASALDSDALEFALRWSSALWLALLGLLAWHAFRDRAPLKWLFWLGLAVLAALVRRQVPFMPLHANGHGLEEILVAIGDPDAHAATSRYVAQYGPAWLTPLRALTRLIGQTHDQLGVVSSALGGLAAAFGTAAAWRMSRQWLWTAMAAAILIFVPVAARVGHSESPFVVAQLLVALALWLSTHPTRGLHLAMLLALALLVLGHPVGIGFAFGVYLLVVASGLDGADWRPAQHLILLAAIAVAAGVEIAQCHAGVSDRLTDASRFHIPVPAAPHHYWLWLQNGYAPRMAMIASCVGLWSFGRGRPGRMRWVTLATATLGAVLVAMAALMVTACVSDGLRYQAPFAPVLAVLVARAGQGLSGQLQGRALATILWLAIVLGFGGLREGRRPDAQGQSYLALRQGLRGLTGDVWLVASDRTDGHDRVVVQMPAGRLARGRANLRTLLAEDAVDACRLGAPLPKPAFVWMDHACMAIVPVGDKPPCDALASLAGETLQAFTAVPLAPPTSVGMAGEFDSYPPGALKLTLARLRCP